MQKGKKYPELSGENSATWKGDNANNSAFHKWLSLTKGKPIKCQFCGKIGKINNGRWNIHWANINKHQYTRNPNDYIALCVSCHRKYDGITDETRKKMSFAKIGKSSWNKGIKGIMKVNSGSFKKGNPPPSHKLNCQCFRCIKKNNLNHN